MNREHPHDGEIVHRTLQLLRAIAGFGSEWFGITMLAKQTGIPKSSIHRYLAIFIAEGILERHLHYGHYRQALEEPERSKEVSTTHPVNGKGLHLLSPLPVEQGGIR